MDGIEKGTEGILSSSWSDRVLWPRLGRSSTLEYGTSVEESLGIRSRAKVVLRRGSLRAVHWHHHAAFGPQLEALFPIEHVQRSIVPTHPASVAPKHY